MTRGLRAVFAWGKTLGRAQGGGGGQNLNALHHCDVQGLALVPLKAVALQPGILQGLLG